MGLWVQNRHIEFIIGRSSCLDTKTGLEIDQRIYEATPAGELNSIFVLCERWVYWLSGLLGIFC